MRKNVKKLRATRHKNVKNCARAQYAQKRYFDAKNELTFLAKMLL